MDSLPEALRALSAYRQFILWVPERQEDGNVIKRPVNWQTGRYHDPHDPAVWLDAQTAIELHKKVNFECGVGFVLTEGDDFFLLDSDHSLQDNGQWADVAVELCTRFAGCAVEVSQSGTGLHIIGRGKFPPHGCKNKFHGLELYTEKRFIALTGLNAYGDAGFTVPVDLANWTVSRYFPPGIDKDSNFEWTTSAVPEWNGPEDDQDLITKMLSSSSAAAVFGGRASILELWTADPSLGKYYPPFKQNDPFDRSSAEMALCSHLAFWTGKNCERIDRIFRMSALMRDKWEKREPYRKDTIGKAVAACKSVYSAKRNVEPIQQSRTVVEPIAKTGAQFVNPDQQLELFKGCCYIRHEHKIMIPGGALLKPEQFKVIYGGYKFILDENNEKITNSAWEAFTESQVYTFPKVDNLCFRPDMEHGAIVKEENELLINTYSPIETERLKGDPSPFLDVVNRLFPDETDRNIILAYMAACVQYAGKKFLWAPVVQGVQGNGKSFISGCVARAVGLRYSHTVQPNDLGNHFNAWLRGKLFIRADEIYINDRKDKVNALKPLITDEQVAITPKGVDQYTGDNYANFFCTMNPIDGIRKTRNDRRFCVFMTPQQSVDDLKTWGMTGNYFYNLFTWAKNGGYAIVNDYLRSYAIPDELNPATKCNRAPETTTTAQAIEAGLGRIEQEIIEAKEEGRVGFCGDWLSSIKFTELLEEKHLRVSRNKMREILHEMGYIPHPALKGGRVNNLIPTEGGKPRLYIRSGAIHANLTQPTEIIRCYLQAQGLHTAVNGVDHSVNKA